MPPVGYPQLPLVDPTPAVPYPPARVPADQVPPAVVPAPAPLSSQPAVIPGPLLTQPVASGSAGTVQGGGQSGTSGPRPDSGLGTSDSENPAYLSCIESSESSDDSDSDIAVSPSAPTDQSDDQVAHQALARPDPQAEGGHAHAQAPNAQVHVVQIHQSGDQATQGQALQASAAPPRNPSRSGRSRSRSGRVRDRGGRARGRGHRERRIRKREWEESEGSLSSPDDEAPFPSRISPRNKKPFQGYTNF